MQNTRFLKLFKIKKGFGEKEFSYLRNFKWIYICMEVFAVCYFFILFGHL